MRGAFRMVIVIATAALAACPDEKPVDLSPATRADVSRAASVARPPAAERRPMPDGRVPFVLPRVERGPTLAFAPTTIVFDDGKILEVPTASGGDSYSGAPVPYTGAPISDGVVTARLDDAPAEIALFVRYAGSALATLGLVADKQPHEIALAVTVNDDWRQLPYVFGAIAPAARERIELDVAADEVLVGTSSLGGVGEPPFDARLREVVDARRSQSSLGIEARIVVRAGMTNEDLADLLVALAAAKVEVVQLSRVVDASPHATMGLAGRTTAVPSVRIGQPQVAGDLDKAIIRRYIKRNIQKLAYCYEKELLAQPELRGSVSVSFVIAPTGKVTTATASGVDPRVSSCVARVIEAIEFPHPKSDALVQVHYPFVFQPTGG